MQIVVYNRGIDMEGKFAKVKAENLDIAVLRRGFPTQRFENFSHSEPLL